jgi:hypothetical protein
LGCTDSAEDAVDAQGVLRIPTPPVPGAEVRATVVWLPETAGRRGIVRSPSLEQEVTEVEAGPHPVVARMPVRASPAFTADVRLAGPTRSAALARMRERAPSDAVMLEEDVGEAAGPADPAKVGRIRVRVRGTDGEPLACASVYCANSILETDAEDGGVGGRARRRTRALVFLSGGFCWFSTVAAEAALVDGSSANSPRAARRRGGGRGRPPRPLASVRVAVLHGSRRTTSRTCSDSTISPTHPAAACSVASRRVRSRSPRVAREGGRGEGGRRERGRVTARIVVR